MIDYFVNSHRSFSTLLKIPCTKPSPLVLLPILSALVRSRQQFICYRFVEVRIKPLQNLILSLESDLAFAIADCCSMDPTDYIKQMAEKAESLDVSTFLSSKVRLSP